MEIQAAPVKAVRRDFTFHLAAGSASGIIHLRAVLAFAVPKRGHAEGHRPVCRLLENGGVTVIPHLVAVVVEGLSEGTKFRPSLVAGRARHPVLPREGRKRVHFDSRSGESGSGRATREKQYDQEKTKQHA